MNFRSRILLIAACLSIGFVIFQWLRPYDWQADEAAYAKIDFTRIERDQSFFWLDVRLEVTDSDQHDFSKPLTLILADGSEKKPDTLAREGTPGNPASNDPSALSRLEAISLKFWLEGPQLVGPLKLRINDGILTIREGTDIPPLEDSSSQIHSSKNW